MKKEEQSDHQLPVLESANHELRKIRTRNYLILSLGGVLMVSGFVFGQSLFGTIGVLCSVLALVFFRSQKKTNVIEAEGRAVEDVLKSRLSKLKYGDHPGLGEKASEVFERYQKVFRLAEKTLYEKLNPQELTAQRFQKIFEELKENLQKNFQNVVQTLEISSKQNLDSAKIQQALQLIEQDLQEVEKTMRSLHQTELGSSHSTFDQTFLIDEMKRLTERLQKMEK